MKCLILIAIAALALTPATVLAAQNGAIDEHAPPASQPPYTCTVADDPTFIPMTDLTPKEAHALRRVGFVCMKQ
jgi:hypothetical protein